MANILISIGIALVIALVSFFNIIIAIFISEQTYPNDPILWTCLALAVNSLLIYLVIR
jgi:hypothetical protein